MATRGEQASHADILAEIRASILRGVERRVSQIFAQKHDDLPHTVNAISNSLARSMEHAFDSQFATGYSGGVTVVPFTVNISIIGGPDIVAGS